MKLEEIEDLWKEDAKIDSTNLDQEALKIPDLHHKYYKIYYREQLVHEKYRLDYYQLKRIKTEYYKGQLDINELNNRGWPQFNLHLSAREIEVYLESDVELGKEKFRLAAQEKKVKYVESVLQTIAFRNQSIKNAIEFLKFTNGLV